MFWLTSTSKWWSYMEISMYPTCFVHHGTCKLASAIRLFVHEDSTKFPSLHFGGTWKSQSTSTSFVHVGKLKFSATFACFVHDGKRKFSFLFTSFVHEGSRNFRLPLHVLCIKIHGNFNLPLIYIFCAWCRWKFPSTVASFMHESTWIFSSTFTSIVHEGTLKFPCTLHLLCMEVDGNFSLPLNVLCINVHRGLHPPLDALCTIVHRPFHVPLCFVHKGTWKFPYSFTSIRIMYASKGIIRSWWNLLSACITLERSNALFGRFYHMKWFCFGFFLSKPLQPW